MVDAATVIANFISGIILSEATIPQYWAQWGTLTGGETSVGTIGDSIFVGPVRPESDVIPANSIFIAAYDSGSEKTFDNKSETVDYSVNINVRAKHTTDSRQYAFLKAAIIYDFLQREELTGYLDISGIITPVQLAYDEQNNAVFSLNASLKHHDEY